MDKCIAACIFIVFIIGGCTDSDSDPSGTTVTGNKETQIVASDILSINFFGVIPSNQLSTDRPFIVHLEVENIGNNPVTLQVDSSGSYDGDMVIYDYCSDIFEIDSFKMSPSYSGDPDEIEINPKTLQFFEWKSRTPDRDIVSDAGVVCNLYMQLSYDTVASTNAYVYFATPFEILRSFYTRKNMYLLGSNLATDGPLKVNIISDSQQPIAMDNNAWTVSINIENVGDGIVDVKNLTLVLPDEIETAGTNTTSGEDICNLDKAENLEIYKKSSKVITCMFTPPDEKVLIATAYKIKAVVEYTYTIKDSVQLSVKPLG